MRGIPTLSDLSQALIVIVCDRCKRRGRYRRETLIERFGGQMRMPDLRHLIANCPRHGRTGDACEVRFEQPMAEESSPEAKPKRNKAELKRTPAGALNAEQNTDKDTEA